MIDIFGDKAIEILRKTLEANLGEQGANDVWKTIAFDMIDVNNINMGIVVSSIINPDTADQKIMQTARWSKIERDVVNDAEAKSETMTVAIKQYDGKPKFEVDVNMKTMKSGRMLLGYRELDDDEQIIKIRRFQESGKTNPIGVQQIELIDDKLKISYLDKDLQNTHVPSVEINARDLTKNADAKEILAVVNDSKEVAKLEHQYNIQAPIETGLGSAINRMLGR